MTKTTVIPVTRTTTTAAFFYGVVGSSLTIKTEYAETEAIQGYTTETDLELVFAEGVEVYENKYGDLIASRAPRYSGDMTWGKVNDVELMIDGGFATLRQRQQPPPPSAEMTGGPQ